MRGLAMAVMVVTIDRFCEAPACLFRLVLMRTAGAMAVTLQAVNPMRVEKWLRAESVTTREPSRELQRTQERFASRSVMRSMGHANGSPVTIVIL